MQADSSTKSKRGGKRPRAGRPRGRFRVDAPHRSRARFDRRSPVHVTMRGDRWLLGLRSDAVMAALHRVLERYVDGENFQVNQISIQNNHLHAIVEAANHTALERGMRSFTINAARAIHALHGTCGRVFHRYHSTVIRSRRHARNVLAYVLGNWRRHKEDIINGWFSPAIIDRYSSAISFEGWTMRFAVPAGYTPLPVSPPKTWLMRDGWAFDGPLDPYAAPGPVW